MYPLLALSLLNGFQCISIIHGLGHSRSADGLRLYTRKQDEGCSVSCTKGRSEQNRNDPFLKEGRIYQVVFCLLGLVPDVLGVNDLDKPFSHDTCPTKFPGRRGIRVTSR